MIKVCTFNLRINNAGDGINCFDNRFERIVDVIKREKPHVIGFQEGNDYMTSRLDACLDEYVFLGCGREKTYCGEGTYVAVLKRDFRVVSVENFWLSNTPTVAGSSFGGDHHVESGKTFRFCNTHLDHKGENARVLGMRLIIEHLKEHPESFVLTGDFNARPESDVVREISSYTHFGKTVTDTTSSIGGSFHGFGKREVPTKIDYIFTNLPCDPTESYAWEDVPENGVYLSDHLPICSFITLD